MDAGGEAARRWTGQGCTVRVLHGAKQRRSAPERLREQAGKLKSGGGEGGHKGEARMLVFQVYAPV